MMRSTLRIYFQVRMLEKNFNFSGSLRRILLVLTIPNTENQSRRRSFTERNLSNRHGKKGAHLKNYTETFVRNNTCIIEQMFV